jgi:hypothetical protein
LSYSYKELAILVKEFTIRPHLGPVCGIGN